MLDNRKQLVGVAVQGEIQSPKCPPLPASPYIVAADGTPALVPPPGGIVYNVSVGDRAFGWIGDVVHPGVSIGAAGSANDALRGLACIGNTAAVVTGLARGERGTVTGKGGRFAEHVIIDFPQSVRDALAIGDQILVRALGRGLRLTDAPEVQVKSMAPVLLDALELEPGMKSGTVSVAVAAEVPAVLMGAGAGLTSEAGCVQIQSDDRAVIASRGLEHLRLGDVVALQDVDCRWGIGFVKDAVTVGVVVHGDSVRGGHGPGVTPVLTAVAGKIRLEVVESRNIVELLGLGRRAKVPA